MMVPVAMLEVIGRFFGFAALPDYSRSLAVFERDPYLPLRTRLATLWSLLDLTDYNSDLGFVYVLGDHPARLTVRLSIVGPYAVLLDESGHVVQPLDVSEVVRTAGFVLLGQEVLELQVDIWGPEFGGSVYEFLFEFDQGLPWAR
jgi:hypothetical protein